MPKNRVSQKFPESCAAVMGKGSRSTVLLLLLLLFDIRWGRGKECRGYHFSIVTAFIVVTAGA